MTIDSGKVGKRTTDRLARYGKNIRERYHIYRKKHARDLRAFCLSNSFDKLPWAVEKGGRICVLRDGAILSYATSENANSLRRNNKRKGERFRLFYLIFFNILSFLSPQTVWHLLRPPDPLQTRGLTCQNSFDKLGRLLGRETEERFSKGGVQLHPKAFPLRGRGTACGG